MDKKYEAYDQGWDAHWNNRGAETNPYLPGSEEYENWKYGWYDRDTMIRNEEHEYLSDEE